MSPVRIVSKNVHKLKTPTSALGAKVTHEHETKKSRVNVKNESNARIIPGDGEVADMVQSPVHRRTFGSDGTSTGRRKLRGMPANENASNRGGLNHATGPVVAPRRSDRHKGLSTTTAVPQNDDASREMEPRQVRRLPYWIDNHLNFFLAPVASYSY
jgi:hypothetical protein